jgi:arylsulfatase A-like enzyme
MEIAGIQYDYERLDGFSLLPVLKMDGSAKREALFWHYPHYHHQGYKPAGAIREGDYKLIEWYEPALLNEDNPINLFNLSKDIGESKDLADEMPDLATRLREKLHNWKKSINAQEMKPNPDYNSRKADWRFENE